MDELLLAIDDHSLPWKKNLCYYLSKPTVRAEPVLTPSRDDPSAPDHIATHFYGTVLFDDGRFRMWYYAVGWAEEGGTSLGQLVQGPMCYAESEDGIHWTKPNLGRVPYRGSRDNNIIDLPEAHLPDPRIETVTLIRDPGDPDPRRRYKLVYNYHPLDRPFFTIRTATSTDGIDWDVGPELPVDEFVEPSSFYKHDGLYFVNAQTLSPYHLSEGGNPRGRQGYVWVSPDFDRWLGESADSFLLPEPPDPKDRGVPKPYDQVHLGVGAANYGSVLVGLYCIWHNRPSEGDWFGKTTTHGDFGLVVSNDGVHFREPVKGHVYLARDESPVTPVPGKNYPTILCQANGILNVGDETRIYHGRWRNATDGIDYYGEVALATLPRDRWGALGLFPDSSPGAAGQDRHHRRTGDSGEGTVWSAPITLPGNAPAIAVNADGMQGAKVEISDPRFGLLPGYSGENSGTVQAEGGLDCPVVWPAQSLSELAGQRVRLRIHLKRRGDTEPRLYAVYVRSAS
jgi:hypothetical protein